MSGDRSSIQPSRVQPSREESERFGLRVGRWNPTPSDSVRTLPRADLDRFDVVIVRQSADRSDRWFEMLAVDGFEALHADTLVYWSWRDDESPLDVSGRCDRHAGSAGLEGLVRDVFDGYQNHYTSNPLIERAAALEGYVEWAISTADQNGFLTVEGPDGPVAFGVVDWTAGPPDVRLAGVCTHARGAGRYRELVASMMSEARARGIGELRISTQVQNIAVQRTWSSLGWRPIAAYDTTHLIRSSLMVGVHP